MKKIKIAIADDYKIFREGLKISFASDHVLAVIHEADNGEDLLSNIEKEKPDVILMDIDMPGISGY